jgi:hypothetical protein
MPVSRDDWPSLAREMAFLGLPHADNTREQVAEYYKLTLDELAGLMEHPVFARLRDAEKARMESQGPVAAQRFRVEEALGGLTRRMICMMMTPGCKLDEFTRAFKALLSSAGLDQPAEGAVSGANASVAVQINLPVLDSGKLRHIPAGTVNVPVEEDANVKGD